MRLVDSLFGVLWPIECCEQTWLTTNKSLSWVLGLGSWVSSLLPYNSCQYLVQQSLKRRQEMHRRFG